MVELGAGSQVGVLALYISIETDILDVPPMCMVLCACINAILLSALVLTPNNSLCRRNLSRDLSVKYLIPDTVISHIKLHRLYMNVPPLQQS